MPGAGERTYSTVAGEGEGAAGGGAEGADACEEEDS